MSVEVNFEANFTFIAPEKYPAAMRNAMARLGAQLAGELARESPKDTGRLADSWTFEVIDSFSAKAGTNVNYAKNVWLGTTPGQRPWGPIAEWAERKGLPPGPVYHSIVTKGTHGNPFVDRAEKTVRDMMAEIIEHYLKQGGVIK